MAEKIVINTGPLIALSKMQAFEVVEKLQFDFICPTEVKAELLAGEQIGYTIDLPSWLEIVTLENPISPLAIASLDSGEAAVIHLALEKDISLVCIDEVKGRRAANAVGLKVVGSLGLLGRAKNLGVIAEIAPFIQKAKGAGIYYDDDLISVFLNAFGE
jgi:predicted nucleic acid-binding protein